MYWASILQGIHESVTQVLAYSLELHRHSIMRAAHTLMHMRISFTVPSLKFAPFHGLRGVPRWKPFPRCRIRSNSSCNALCMKLKSIHVQIAKCVTRLMVTVVVGLASLATEQGNFFYRLVLFCSCKSTTDWNVGDKESHMVGPTA